MNKLNYFYAFMFNFLILISIPNQLVFAKQEEGEKTSNEVLTQNVSIQIKEVLDAWIIIAAASMVLLIIGGAALIVLSGTNANLREAGKSLVLGSGITITLLLSIYVLVQLVLKIFGLALP